MHQMRAGSPDHFGNDGFARGHIRFAFRYLPAVGFDGALLCGRRVSRHHDISGNSAPTRRLGQRRGVVAGRWRSDAKLCLLLGQGKYRVGGSANLERARLLQVLELEEELRFRDVIKSRAGNHRRAMDARRDQAMRGANGIQVKVSRSKVERLGRIWWKFAWVAMS